MSKKKNRVRVFELTLLPALLLMTACGMGSNPLRGADGKLAPCESACVSSLSREPGHRVEPFTYQGRREDARQTLLRVIRNTPDAKIVSEAGDYIHVEFTSPLMRFVDDVEFLFPKVERIVHVRSASRVGYFDFSANRERVERLRLAFFVLNP